MLAAEVSGDAELLDRLLTPAYVSVAADGKVTSKAQIVANARARTKEASAKLARDVSEWHAAHPTRPEVTIVANTAILKWVLMNPAAADPLSSSDVFAYQHGRWRAVYSQHTTATH